MREVFQTLTAMLPLSAAMPARAQYIYITNNGTITITGYTGSDSILTIPTNITGLTVTSIGSNAFTADFGLKVVSIPVTITNIGDSAFEQCLSLTDVSIGTNVNSIGNFAFGVCPLNGLMYRFAIPNSVTSIGDGAFANSRLTGASISAYVTNLGGNPFNGCASVTSISVATNNAYYTNVGGIVYSKDKSTIVAYPPGNATTSYSLSNFVTAIGNDVFGGCNNLTNVMIPAGVTNITGAPFPFCNYLLAINVATNNLNYKSAGGSVAVPQFSRTHSRKWLSAASLSGATTSSARPSAKANVRATFPSALLCVPVSSRTRLSPGFGPPFRMNRKVYNPGMRFPFTSGKNFIKSEILTCGLTPCSF